MTDPSLAPHNHSSTSCYSVFEGGNERRRSSCCTFCDTIIPPLNPLEYQTMSLTPPLDTVYYESDENQPFSCIYLLNLFLAPDMSRYFTETSISDDVYSLPVHLQRLICEARMEALVSNENKERPALKRLEKVRAYIQTVAHHDTEAIIKTLHELIQNEDELSNILGE
ncbi:uncharacterized protein BX663DRAFT_512472 [Cokeromyces recurvatus]|uniref:uncharacterized protein n=1 Tax=Cokeromyces recurvatus TaxID=90255 RepID=UPI00221F9E67|nr:uncharacterized protein BX663DRAFT_512472 [Cokeromyces recurvatus]KAI7901802.1 hypothetical protein BX663DRAFT_512472 [Cokeromyces recurvatus]